MLKFLLLNDNYSKPKKKRLKWFYYYVTSRNACLTASYTQLQTSLTFKDTSIWKLYCIKNFTRPIESGSFEHSNRSTIPSLHYILHCYPNAYFFYVPCPYRNWVIMVFHYFLCFVTLNNVCFYTILLIPCSVSCLHKLVR